jgi:hypothetical protein
MEKIEMWKLRFAGEQALGDHATHTRERNALVALARRGLNFWSWDRSGSCGGIRQLPHRTHQPPCRYELFALLSTLDKDYS